jgi:hypothetical protein
MSSHAILTRILVDGGTLALIVGAVLTGMLYFNPRIALPDYPADARNAVPPRTKKELQLGILISIPLLLVFAILPIHSVWQVKQQAGGTLSYGTAFTILFGEFFLVSMFDLLVLDLRMFCTLTPKFLVLPGTEGMAGYKDCRSHVKAQLTWGTLLTVMFAAVLACVPVYFL